jgi:hypothetical protein
VRKNGSHSEMRISGCDNLSSLCSGLCAAGSVSGSTLVSSADSVAVRFVKFLI